MLIKWSVYCTVLYFTLLNAIHTRYRKNAYSTPLPSLGGRLARTDYLTLSGHLLALWALFWEKECPSFCKIGGANFMATCE